MGRLPRSWGWGRSIGPGCRACRGSRGLAKLGEAPAQYREIGQRLHSIIRESAPSLEPIVRWGLPFYVKDGKDICYIKPDRDFIAFGFGEAVNPAREEGAHMHPVAWTLTALDAATEAKIRALIEKAVA